ncbi:flippase [Pseudalkalibacillus caeni]|uniref:Flippase n=1 Tax=Exobacillus caeni TaxID=2574798 RepID=A0A5R9FC85_9BACL|nr:flippase [Pseudalkalibacillus caeni]TLS38493.1 flippase [Pseudalkalibacillus caeni]
MKGNSFARDSFITLTRQVTSIFIGVLLLVVLARFLGPDGQGKYALIILLPQMLMTFLNMGVNTSTIYYVSKGEIDLHSVFKNNLIIGGVLSLIGLLIGLLVILFFSDRLFSGTPSYLLFISLIGLPFMILNIFFQTIFQGLQNFKFFNTILIVTQMSTLAFIALFIIVFDFGLAGSIVAFILGHIGTTAFILYLLFNKEGLKLRKSILSKQYMKQSLTYGLKAHVSNVMTFLNYRADIILLGFFIGPAAVGIYVVAVNIGERLSIFAQSISSVLLPKISSLKDDLERNQLTSIISRNVLAFILIGSLSVFFLSDFVIDLLFDPRYEESSPLLKLLLPGIAVLSVEKILSNDIAARGKPELNMYVSFFNVPFNVVLNVILIPQIGVSGAAIATSVTYIISFIIKIAIFKKVTGEDYANFLFIQKSDFAFYKRLYNQVKYKIVKS